jgi:hypothetical protein
MAVWRTVEAERRSYERSKNSVLWDAVKAEAGLTEKQSYYDLPKDLQEKYDKASTKIRKEAWDIPDRLPPQIPADIVVMVPDGKDKWRTVSAEETANIEVPPDPIRVAHDKEFAEIFARLEEFLEQKVTRREIKNRYYNDENNNEPWYEFTVGVGTFIMGPRKRVINIDCSFPAPRDVQEIRDLGKRDNTTYEAGGSWKSEADTSKSVKIHAWKIDTCVEYLICLSRIARATPCPDQEAADPSPEASTSSSSQTSP